VQALPVAGKMYWYNLSTFRASYVLPGTCILSYIKSIVDAVQFMFGTAPEARSDGPVPVGTTYYYSLL
jgi:hypothetical protein